MTDKPDTFAGVDLDAPMWEDKMTAQTAIEKLRELMFYTYDDVLLKRDELCKIVAEFDALVKERDDLILREGVRRMTVDLAISRMESENAALRQNSASMEDTNRRLADALVKERDDLMRVVAEHRIWLIEPETEAAGWLDGGTFDGKPFMVKCADRPMTHDDAEKWAEQQGGALPTRKQGYYLTTLKGNPAFAHLFNRGDSFPAGYVWLADPDIRSGAWCQRLSGGYQGYHGIRDGELPVLCVRSTTLSKKYIDIGNDFSRYPGGRFPADGPYNGETFRERFLIPALKEHEHVIVTIDNVMGYGSSFLEESFGGLVRQGFSPDALKQKLSLVFTNDVFQEYAQEIWEYIKELPK